MRSKTILPSAILLLTSPVSSSSSSSLSVFSSHASQLHLSSTSSRDSPTLSKDAASAIIGGIVGVTLPVNEGGYLPLAVDVFNRPGASVLVAVEGEKILDGEELDSTISTWHDMTTFEVRAYDPQDIVEQLVGDFRAPVGGVSMEDVEAFVNTLGVDFERARGEGEVVEELKSIVGALRKERVCGGDLKVDVVKVTSLKKLKLVGGSGVYESASGVLSAAVKKLLEEVRSGECGAVVQILRAETFGVEGRMLLAGETGTTQRRLVDGALVKGATNATSMAEIELYQISLWTGVVLVLALSWVICLVGGMDTNMDPMLLAKFKADVGDGVKYD